MSDTTSAITPIDGMPSEAMWAAMQLAAARVRWQTTRRAAQLLQEAAQTQERDYQEIITILRDACPSEAVYNALFSAAMRVAKAGGE